MMHVLTHKRPQADAHASTKILDIDLNCTN